MRTPAALRGDDRVEDLVVHDEEPPFHIYTAWNAVFRCVRFRLTAGAALQGC